MITCPLCDHQNPPGSINCEKCHINLAWALEHPQEVEEKRREKLKGVSPLACPHCGKLAGLRLNLCPYCGAGLRKHEEKEESRYPLRITKPTSYPCFVLHVEEGYVLESPDPEARRLFVVSQKDRLPILDEVGDFYKVALPRGGEGFINRKCGRLLEFAFEEVTEPLGYYCVDENVVGWAPGSKPIVKEVMVRAAPDDAAEPVAIVTPEARVPIVEERNGWFKVQLPGGLRGWVPERYGFRTLRPDSLPVVPKPPEREPLAVSLLKGAAAVAAGVILLVGAGIAAAAEQAEKDRRMREAVRAGVQDALR